VESQTTAVTVSPGYTEKKRLTKVLYFPKIYNHRNITLWPFVSGAGIDPTSQVRSSVRPPCCAPSATIICLGEVVLRRSYYAAHFKHCALFLGRWWGRFGRKSRWQLWPFRRSTKTVL